MANSDLGQHVLKAAHRYDDPRHWFDAEVVRPPVFDLKAFQKKVNRATGVVGANHQPIIKISWAPDVIIRKDNEWQRKYTVFETELDGIGKLQIVPPRFVVEQRIEPAQYLPHWNVERFGEAPLDGMYEFVFYVANHEEDEACCYRATALFRKGKLPTRYCHGLYRLPGDDTIETLQFAWQQINSRKHANPHEVLSEEEIAEAFRHGRTVEEEIQRRKDAEFSDLINSDFAIWGHRFDASPKTLSQGKWLDVGGSYQKAKKSGLFVPIY